ncbi:MAG: Holliday junction resolvase YqgF [Caulobacter sp.]|nr:Holliday junction resolvase YqgF [Caulobacter sp.]
MAAFHLDNDRCGALAAFDARRTRAYSPPMAILDLLDLPAALPQYAPIVGLDPGEKTIGVAVSDITRTVASPLDTIRREKFGKDAEALFKLMESRGALGIVIGLPVNMDGAEGVRCQSNRAFGRNLLRLRDIPIAFWDERLSTAAVTRVLIDEHDVNRKKRAEVVDKLAATWILQGALERLRNAQAVPPPGA